MRSRRDLLASIGAATALGGCDMRAPRRPYPFRNGRGLSFKTLTIDDLGRTCAVGMMEERPGGRFRERIALFNLEALGSEPGQPLVAESVQGEPGFDDWLPVFGDEGAHLYFSRVSRADEARFRDRAPTRIIRRNLKSGAQEVVLEISAKALPQAVFQVEGESYLIYQQAVEFSDRWGYRDWVTKFALRTVRLGGGGKVPAFGPLHDDVDYRGDGIAIPGIGYLFRRYDRGEDERDFYRFAAFSMTDIVNGSMRKFSNFEESADYFESYNRKQNYNHQEIDNSISLLQILTKYSDTVESEILGQSSYIKSWNKFIQYNANSRFAIAIKGRSVLDDERDLERVPFVRFEGGRIPMTPESAGLVNFKPFVDSAFPL